MELVILKMESAVSRSADDGGAKPNITVGRQRVRASGREGGREREGESEREKQR